MAEQATIERAKRAFAERFGGEPALIAQAPGRVNLIGEHTDYNDGFVLPLAIDRGTVVAARAGGDAVAVWAADYGEEDLFTLDQPVEAVPGGSWRNYVRGMVALLQGEGVPVPAMQLSIAGDVPQGAGLSSSASLEVAVGLAVAALAGVELDPTRLALLAQRAENEYAGCACGIMDQLVSARAQEGHALLIDCRSLECRSVPVPDELRVLIIHSGVAHQNTDGSYNERRRQCEQAAAHFTVPALRDASVMRLEESGGLDALAFQRARHVVTENDRTEAAAGALAMGDLARLGQLMSESHASQRDDFGITVPETDRLVEIVSQALGEQGGARQTGGGFGGCVIALVPETRLDAVIEAVRRDYRTPAGEPPFIHVCRPAAGAGLI
jgi:galactokinase